MVLNRAPNRPKDFISMGFMAESNCKSWDWLPLVSLSPIFPLLYGLTNGYFVVGTNSAIHKASSFTVHGRSTGLPGIIPMEQKSVHWLSMGAASRNDLPRSCYTAAL